MAITNWTKQQKRMLIIVVCAISLIAAIVAVVGYINGNTFMFLAGVLIALGPWVLYMIKFNI